MTDNHFVPQREDASNIDLVLCESRDSRTDPLIVWKASWHRFLAGRGILGWLRHCPGREGL